MNELERSWQINGEVRRIRFAPLARLLDVLREQGLLSLKEGCGEGECGTCSLIVDGELRLACLTAAAQLEDGTAILTAEGLARDDRGRVLQQAFTAAGAVQCGYCTPGMLLGSYALLAEQADPDEETIRGALAGHLCRCTGYGSIVEAVQTAARQGAAVQAAAPSAVPAEERER